MYAKKKSHLAAYGPVTKNKFGEYEGPFLLSSRGTKIITNKGTTNCRRLGQRTPYTGIDVALGDGPDKYVALGLAGLAWLKSHGIESVVLPIVGLGDTVKRELGASSSIRSYPKGVSLEEACVVEVAR